MRWLTIALIITSGALPPACSVDDPGVGKAPGTTFHDLHKLGMARMMEGNLDAAASAFEQALAIEPGHPGASSSLAQILFMQKRDEEALRHIDLAIENDPPPPDVSYLTIRKNVLIQLGREDEALATLERILELDPGDSDALRECCEMHLKKAEASLARVAEVAGKGIGADASRRDPYFEAQIRYLRGVAWEKKGDRERAEAAFREAIEVWPRNPNPYQALGKMMMYAGRTEEATVLLERHDELRRVQEAIDANRSVMAREPDRLVEILRSLVLLHVELGQLVEADRCCESLIAALPGHPEPLVYKGMVKRLRKRYGTAERTLLQVIEAEPRFSGAYDELAILYASAEDERFQSFPKAWEMVRRAKNFGGVDPLTEAQILVLEGKRDRALTTLRRALVRGEGDRTLVRRRIQEMESEPTPSEVPVSPEPVDPVAEGSLDR